MGTRSGAWERGVLRWHHFLIALAVIILLFLIVMHGVRSDVIAVQKERDEALNAQKQAQAVYDELANQLERVGTSGYIENLARLNYAYQNPKEVRFEVSNPEALYNYTDEEMAILQEELKYGE